MGGWEDLPYCLINEVSKYLESYVDYVRFRAVCVSWNSALPKRPSHQFKQKPWLMLNFVYERQTCYNFYSFLDEKVYHLELSETEGKWFRGSSHGWLVTVENGPELYLLNPLTKVQIPLPPLYTFPVDGYIGGAYVVFDFRYRRGKHYWGRAYFEELYIQKLVLSSPPHDDFLAMAIHGRANKLAFCSRSNMQWTTAETNCFCDFGDVIFYEDKIYALGDDGKLLVSDRSSLPKFTLIPIESLPDFGLLSKLYLVGSNNGLMMVERCYNLDDVQIEQPQSPKTVGFKIYLLESYPKMLKWSEITYLGHNAMFLGYNASTLISSIDFPNLKGNCIYYTHDQMQHWVDDCDGFDMGIFDLEDGRIKEFGELNLDGQFGWRPPIWLMPNP